jgi:hypothetical protein
MNDNHSCLNLNSTQTTSNMTPTTTTTTTTATSNNTGSNNNRKPCNCTKSQCLKLYCDCFAIGSFCYDCNCINCWNTLEHEDERNKAIKLVLERNPSAFQSKIGKFSKTTRPLVVQINKNYLLILILIRKHTRPQRQSSRQRESPTKLKSTKLTSTFKIGILKDAIAKSRIA